MNTTMNVRISISRVADKTVFQPLCPDTGAPLHVSASFDVREGPNMHLEFDQLMSQTECGHPGIFL